MKTASQRDLLRVALDAAHAAAETIRAGAENLAAVRWQLKRTADFVSEVDTDSEHRIREVIERAIPGAVVVGEELSPESALGCGVAFIVDPLDGTTNFLHGYPQYAVSVAATIDGELEAGVVLDVPHGDVFAALRGRGATRNDTPIAVSKTTDPSSALVGTGFPFKYLEFLDDFQRQFATVVRHTAGVRRAGSAALDLADVACGRFDAFWELRLAPWDIAAGLLLIREAGGVATDLIGAPALPSHTGLVAGNTAMHAWLLEALEK